MTCNDDFSFVRFLKVVKTLYESSTFTQLGKTVGSALTHQPPSQSKEYHHAEEKEENFRSSGKNGDDDLTHQEKHRAPQSSVMAALAACTSPTNSTGRSKSQSRKNDRDVATVDTRDTRTPSSLLEQVINCTYVHGDDPYSDEDTYRSQGDRSYDDATLGDSTFDSMTDDGYDSTRRARGRSRRRRRS
jgi:hypothetical protein